MTLVKRKLANTKLAFIYHKNRIAIVLAGILVMGSMLIFCSSWRDAEGMTKNVINQIDVFVMQSVFLM